MRFKFTKRWIFWLLACIGFSGAIGAGYAKFQALRRVSAADRFRTAPIRPGDIAFEVKCTGTVQPVLSVQVGSYVSGPIVNVNVDFNDRVKKNQLLAEIDPQVYNAQLRQTKANLAHSKADLQQYQAKLEQTKRDFERAKLLHELNGVAGLDHLVKGISDSDYDLAKANYEMAVAGVEVANAAVEQNEALLDVATTNLKYTSIVSPVDGIVIDRKVDAGQTLASQFQTPVMFVVAPDLEKVIRILASVDEADIGLVRKAEAKKQPVHFTVDAYQDEIFEGKIAQVRLGPKAPQQGMQANVVTYTAVIEATNSELKLLPGMTANITFQIEKHEKVLKLPNAALRFHPTPDCVHPKHLALLEGLHSDDEGGEKSPAGADEENEDKNSDNKKIKENKRFVWVIDGELLSPVEATVGISNSDHTEILSADLKEGRKVVTGIKTAAEITSSHTDK